MSNQGSNPSANDDRLPSNVVSQVMIHFLVEQLRSTQLALDVARGEIAERDAAVAALTAALRNSTTAIQPNAVENLRLASGLLRLALERRDAEIKLLKRLIYCLAVIVGIFIGFGTN